MPKTTDDFCSMLEIKYNNEEKLQNRLDKNTRTNFHELKEYVQENPSASSALDKLVAVTRCGRIPTEVLNNYGRNIYSLYLILIHDEIINASMLLIDFEEKYRTWVIEGDHVVGDFFLKDHEPISSVKLSGQCDMNQLVLAHIYFIAFLKYYNPVLDLKGHYLCKALNDCMNILCNTESVEDEHACTFSGYPVPDISQKNQDAFFKRKSITGQGILEMRIASTQRDVKVAIDSKMVFLSFDYSVSPEIRDCCLGRFAIALSKLLAKKPWNNEDINHFYLLCSDLMWSHLWLNGNGRLSKLVETCISLKCGLDQRKFKNGWSGYGDTIDIALIAKIPSADPDPNSVPVSLPLGEAESDDDFFKASEDLPAYRPR